MSGSSATAPAPATVHAAGRHGGLLPGRVSLGAVAPARQSAEQAGRWGRKLCR
jgi:hypothetical protein